MAVDNVVPINAPSRAELWRRVRLAEAILNNRPVMPVSTAQLLLRVLRGEDTAESKLDPITPRPSRALHTTT
jgi:hypothetical protein